MLCSGTRLLLATAESESHGGTEDQRGAMPRLGGRLPTVGADWWTERHRGAKGGRAGGGVEHRRPDPCTRRSQKCTQTGIRLKTLLNT